MQREGLRLKRRHALWLAWVVMVALLAWLVTLGPRHPCWFLTAPVVLLASCLFGPRTGFLKAGLVTVAVALSAGLVSNGILQPGDLGVLVHVAVVILVVLAVAACGALLARTLSTALFVEVHKDQRIEETMRALRHREKVLRHAMRVETVGEIASMVVHELRNQFQMILGLATVGRQQVGDTPGGERFDSIRDVVTAANETLENLLGMVHADEETPRCIDVVPVLREMGARFRQVLPQRIDFSVDLPPQPVFLLLDERALEHALLNLMINARQAMPDGGRIRLQVVVSGAGDSATIQVEDNGPGMSEQVCRRIFEPFFTTKPKGEGTGLGLAAVRRFAIGGGGQVEVDSQLGRGTRFVLRFPVARANAATA